MAGDSIPDWVEDGPRIKVIDASQYNESDESVVDTMMVPEASVFQTRGKMYMKDKKKEVSTGPVFKFSHLKVYSYHENITHVAQRIKSLQKFLAETPEYEHIVLNRMLPTSPILNVIIVYSRKKGEKAAQHCESLLQKYKTEGDAFRNLRLKYLVRIPNASWMIRTGVGALGGFRPVIMGKGYLQQFHFLGNNYYELDVDIGTSRIARSVMGLIVPQQRKLIIDEAMVLEGQDESELPEVLLTLHRGIRLDLPSLGIKATDDLLNEPEDYVQGSSDSQTAEYMQEKPIELAEEGSDDEFLDSKDT